MTRTLLVAIAMTLVVVAPRPSAACVHAAASSMLGPADHTAIISYRDGLEDLVVQPAYYADKPPSSMGIVIPVPNEPVHYGTLDPAIFDSLHTFVGLKRTGRTKGMTRGIGRKRHLELDVSPTVETGPYKITPLRSRNGAAPVNAWLRENGFAEIPANTLAYYADRHWTFLTIKVTAKASEFASRGTLPPVHIRFPYDRIVYPFHLERPRASRLLATLYLFTDGPLPSPPNDEESVRRRRKLPDRLREVGRGSLSGNVGLHSIAKLPKRTRAFLSAAGWDADGEVELSVIRGNLAGMEELGRSTRKGWSRRRGTEGPVITVEDFAIPAATGDERLESAIANTHRAGETAMKAVWAGWAQADTTAAYATQHLPDDEEADALVEEPVVGDAAAKHPSPAPASEDGDQDASPPWLLLAAGLALVAALGLGAAALRK